MRKVLVVAAALALAVALATPAAAAGSTTYQAQTANNTSTCVLGSPSSPSDCVATFAGQTDTRTGTRTPLFDPPGGNVSTDPAAGLLYSGATTKVFANLMLGFCTPADGTSSPGVPRCNSNVLTQYTSNNTATVDKHLRDFVQRGINGMVMTWYGPGSSVNAATLKYQAEIAAQGYCAGGAQKCQVMYLNMYDGSTLKYPVTATGIAGTTGAGCSTTAAATDAENCVIGRLRNDICYQNGYHFGNNAYQKWNGRPIIQFFIDEGHEFANLPKTGPAPSWADVWYWVRQWANNLPGNCAIAPYSANNGAPLFLFENAGGFTHAQSDGGYDWITVGSTQDNEMVTPATTGGTVTNFYATATAHPTMLAWGAAYKGFNDVQSAWTGNRLMDQHCGQTWLNSLGAAGSYYSTSAQLPFVQVATWNDYNEGTSIEDGIDNCYTVGASVSGSTLSWSANSSASYATLATVARWLVFDSTDGGASYTQLASLPASSTSYSLASLPAGTHKLFVKMVGKADIRNQSSTQLTFTH